MNGLVGLGRLLGASMLLTVVVSTVSNFKLQSGLFAGGGLLVNAAANAGTIGVVCLLEMLVAGVALALASMLLHHFRDDAPCLARLYFGILAALLAVAMVEGATLYAFQDLSTLYAATDADQQVQFKAANEALRGLRNGVHFIHKFAGGAGALVLFLLLYRLRLIPRAIAGFGVLAAPLQMAGLGNAVLGREVIFPLLLPLGLAYLATIGWLLFRGFPVAASRTSAQPVAMR